MIHWYYVWFRATPEGGRPFKGECVITCALIRNFQKNLYNKIEDEYGILIKNVHVRGIKKLN
jgi:hypothetical protein